LLSIIIVTFNSINFIRTCLDSLLKQSHKDIEVVVIDNGSCDGTVNFLKKNYSQVRLIENQDNLGVCRARNQGIGLSRGEWVLTLDCDTVLAEDFINEIKIVIDKIPPEVGILQPKIMKSDRKRIYSAGIFVSFLRRFYDIGRDRLDGGRFDKTGYIFGACSASALYKRQMLEEVSDTYGYFDERFFFLLEDVDLAYRAQKKGWKALYYPKTVCYHSGNSSLLDNKKRQYLCWRNRKMLLKKLRISTLHLAVIILIYDLPRALYLFLTNNYARAELPGRGHRHDFIQNQ